MQNLNLCKTHRFIELLVIRSPMHIYIRKKNVEIFKLYQNCRNDVQFNSSLRKKGKMKVIFFFSVFRFTNKQIQKIEKRKSISVFPFSFYSQKYTKKQKTKTYFCFPFFVSFAKNTKKTKKRKSTSVFRFIYSQK